MVDLEPFPMGTATLVERPDPGEEFRRQAVAIRKNDGIQFPAHTPLGADSVARQQATLRLMQEDFVTEVMRTFKVHFTRDPLTGEEIGRDDHEAQYESARRFVANQNKHRRKVLERDGKPVSLLDLEFGGEIPEDSLKISYLLKDLEIGYISPEELQGYVKERAKIVRDYQLAQPREWLEQSNPIERIVRQLRGLRGTAINKVIDVLKDTDVVIPYRHAQEYNNPEHALGVFEDLPGYLKDGRDYYRIRGSPAPDYDPDTGKPIDPNTIEAFLLAKRIHDGNPLTPAQLQQQREWARRDFEESMEIGQGTAYPIVKGSFDLETELEAIKAKGYRGVKSPEHAAYLAELRAINRKFGIQQGGLARFREAVHTELLNDPAMPREELDAFFNLYARYYGFTRRHRHHTHFLYDNFQQFRRDISRFRSNYPHAQAAVRAMFGDLQFEGAVKVEYTPISVICTFERTEDFERSYFRKEIAKKEKINANLRTEIAKSGGYARAHVLVPELKDKVMVLRAGSSSEHMFVTHEQEHILNYLETEFNRAQPLSVSVEDVVNAVQGPPQMGGEEEDKLIEELGRLGQVQERLEGWIEPGKPESQPVPERPSMEEAVEQFFRIRLNHAFVSARDEMRAMYRDGASRDEIVEVLTQKKSKYSDEEPLYDYLKNTRIDDTDELIKVFGADPEAKLWILGTSDDILTGEYDRTIERAARAMTTLEAAGYSKHQVIGVLSQVPLDLWYSRAKFLLRNNNVDSQQYEPELQTA